MAVRHYLVGLLCMACTLLPHGAMARTGDRDQQIKATSTKASGSGAPNETSILTGQVKVTQGTLVATGDRAELYTDANAAVIRVVLTGKRAHIQQQSDDGSLAEADADTIDYTLDTDKAILTGHATTNQQGSGTAAAPKITYNVVDNTFFAEGSPTETVNMTFLPKKKAAPVRPLPPR